MTDPNQIRPRSAEIVKDDLLESSKPVNMKEGQSTRLEPQNAVLGSPEPSDKKANKGNVEIVITKPKYSNSSSKVGRSSFDLGTKQE